jgi:predicted enzyme related to lactoylglutathione lyase
MISAGTHGAVTWTDLSTPDVKAAAEFYQELLGWNDVVVSATAMGDYHIAMVGDHQVCGMMGQGPELSGAPPMWTIFVYVDDVDSTAGRVAEAGGTVLTPPFDIPDARIAVIADPTGAVFGLFGGPEIEGEFYSENVGRICWAELMTRDPEGVQGFYGDLFGWKAVTELAAGNPYTTFKLGDDMAAGMMMMPADVPPEVPAYWSMYFTVADCAGTEKRAAEMGGEVYVPTMTLDMGKFASLADPQGATFNIMEYDK